MKIIVQVSFSQEIISENRKEKKNIQLRIEIRFKSLRHSILFLEYTRACLVAAIHTHIRPDVVMQVFGPLPTQSSWSYLLRKYVVPEYCLVVFQQTYLLFIVIDRFLHKYNAREICIETEMPEFRNTLYWFKVLCKKRVPVLPNPVFVSVSVSVCYGIVVRSWVVDNSGQVVQTVHLRPAVQLTDAAEVGVYQASGNDTHRSVF